MLRYRPFLLTFFLSVLIVPFFSSLVIAEQNKPEAAQQNKPASTVPQATTPLPASHLVVQTILVEPSPTRATIPFDVTIQFANMGNKPTSPGQQYSLSCKVISGGPNCPLPTGVKTISASVDPNGAMHFAKFAGITGPAGTYELAITFLPVKPGDTPRTSQVTIIPKPDIQKVPLKKDNPLGNRGVGPIF